MMFMKCSYCSSEIKKGRGLMYVYNTGAVKYYCSGRCFTNNVKLKRKFNTKEAKIKKQ
jgi:ribosomal protein L24E